MEPGTDATLRHDHTFGQDQRMPGERRTVIVIAITATMMVVEITAGLAFGSMALLADGLHMASHTLALAVAAFAYLYARRRAADPRFSFGTGKVNSLGGFTGAVLLAGFAVMMAWESVERFIYPVSIQFNQAIVVAFLGLVVNGASALILGGGPHEHQDGEAHGAEGDHVHHHEHDHNLRSAYLHVLADALTSLLAIFALLAGKYAGLNWLDPAMGIVGALLVAHWSVALMRVTSRVLLDHQAPPRLCSAITEAIESRDGSRVTDLHVWAIGPGRYAAIVSVVTENADSADRYKTLIPSDLGLCHVTVETSARSARVTDNALE